MNPEPSSLSGVWHLLAESQQETPLPGHRMDLRFHEGAGELRVTVLSRTTGEEMSVIHAVSFDAGVLKLQMVAPPGQPQESMPSLIMTETAGRLVGHWQLQGAPVGPGLKLVRGRSDAERTR